MNRLNNKPKALDFIFLIILIAVSVLLIVKSAGGKRSVVLVQAAGSEYEYSLSQEGIYSLEGTLGTTVFEIKDGAVRITESPCQNKICIAQGWSSPLVCLPNDVIITVEKSEKKASGEIDAVSQ